MADDLAELLQGFKAGQVRSLARLISRVEDDPPIIQTVFPALAERMGHAHVIGVTGPPGSGKSTVIDGLVAVLRSRRQTVAVVAVDPSSPFRGGGLLGDRVRMQRHYTDPGVYIRSMATRGALGGLARATWQVVKLLDGFGFDWILVETVGVGQTEVDIARLADVTILVLVPGLGDEIQAIKAGVLEIADVLLVNKADHEGAERLRGELEWRVEQTNDQGGPKPQVLSSVAVGGQGIVELVDHVQALRQSAILSGLDRERRRLRLWEEVLLIAGEQVRSYLEGELSERTNSSTVQALEDHQLDAYTVAHQLLQGMVTPQVWRKLT